jgi:hypothetical protein
MQSIPVVLDVGMLFLAMLAASLPMPPIPITHVMFTPSVRRVQCVDVYRQFGMTKDENNKV